MELLLFLALLIMAGGALSLNTSNRFRVISLVSILVGVAVFAVGQPEGDERATKLRPEMNRAAGYVSSGSCRSCHPSNYDSWHRSFHRTMTQEASPSNVLGDFDDVTLEDRGYSYRLDRRGDEFWVEMPDPLWFMEPRADRPPDPPRIEVQIVMVTGSHHMQYYWVRRPATGNVYLRHDTGELIHIPWVWLIQKQRWVPSQDSFLRPPSSLVEAPLRWNTACSRCHSVATRPGGPDEENQFETQSTELGIACEACHGPGAEHVRAHRSPVFRYMQRLASDAQRDSTIVNPDRLDKRRSAEVCGQCHSFSRSLDQAQFHETGLAFRPGDTLDNTMAVFRHTENPEHPQLLGLLQSEPNAVENRFWDDGTIRVAGREYNGLLETACFRQGEMTCLSCHSMHDYQDASDQIGRGDFGNRPCLRCHSQIEGQIGEHTKHNARSPGSRCTNCHMPRTTYGLFKAIRNHRITSPATGSLVETNRPNACNLCHLDRTLEWTSRYLNRWYGQPAAKLSGDERSVAASILWALKGDAAQRAITAWHMGWESAQEVSGSSWLAPYLAQLLRDSYAVNRRLAYQSLLTLAGFEDFEFDYLSGPDVARQRARAVLSRWRREGQRNIDDPRPSLLLDEGGAIDLRAYLSILRQRDQKPLRISE